MTKIENFMREAIGEAEISLQEGNHGFGAIIVKGDEVIAKAHDLEESDNDPTSHAEINAIRLASKTLGKKMENCTIISTHEPCPMCASAIFWSGIDHVAYGFSIGEAIKQERKRINLTCDEIFKRAGKNVKIEKDILFDQCRTLYNHDVRNEIKKLRNVTTEKLKEYNTDSIDRRLEWYDKNKDTFTFLTDNLLDTAYNLLIARFNIDCSQAEIISRTSNRIVFHSKNFCPTLEACKILNLDTKYICKNYNENSTDELVKQIDKRLKFQRNYEKLRPDSDYCEEIIILQDKTTDEYCEN